jgi:hypothetical protein
MPAACKGQTKLASLDPLNVLLPQVEHSSVTITSLYLKLALLETIPDFALEADDAGALASHWLETLDPGFFDPERASIVAMNELRGEQISAFPVESVDPRKIFSAAELRNSIKLLSATYEVFGLKDSDFETVASIVMGLSARCRDDNFVANQINGAQGLDRRDNQLHQVLTLARYEFLRQLRSVQS